MNLELLDIMLISDLMDVKVKLSEGFYILYYVL